MNERKYEKPLPEVTPLTKPFWDSTKRHELVVQRCKGCGRYIWYPKAWCPFCGSRELEWAKVSGLGTVYAATTTRIVAGNSPAWGEELPYTIAIVDMDEGFRMYGRVVDVKPEEVEVGMRVEIYFEDATEEIAIPIFRPLEKKK